jgi:hypothetical protein
MIIYVVPCSATKLDHPAPAHQLYTGTMFTNTYRAAAASATADQDAGLGPARVLILSALHGLIDPDQVIDPYDLRMGQPGSITPARLIEQAEALDIDWDSQVYALLPRPYFAVLDAALRELDVYPQDVYEATAGIGVQRHVNACVAR